MKKLILLVFAALLALTACSSGGGKTVTEKELTVLTSNELTTMDYLLTSQQRNHEILTNLVDGLLENDSTGKIVGAVAEKWEANETATEFTFTIRDGVKWVTNTGEVYGDVTAHDFVTGLRHGAEFGSEVSDLLIGVVKGYGEYLNSDFSDAAWEQVGVKAVDDKTLVYTLEKSTPYFHTIALYSVLLPVNQKFLESKGDGCKLGQPNKDNCTFGSLAFDSILYNGAFILTQNDAKSVAVLEKNKNYWDADNVFLSKVTRIFTEGQDPYEAIKGFENGTYPSAALNAGWEDYATYVEKYKDNATFTLPNATTFGVVFNFNRQSFNLSNYATNDPAKAENTRKAILNENFRKALRAAYDVVAKIGVTNPLELAQASVRNINNFPDAGTTSTGKLYFDLVTEAYTAQTGETVNLSDGQYPWLSKDAALKFIEAAKAEGIQFPVHLDMLVLETSDKLTKEAQSMKKSISDNTNGQIIIEPVLKSREVVLGNAFNEEDPTKRDYDINTFAGWGPDYGDPKSFVYSFSAENGPYLTNMGLGEGAADADIKEQIGLLKYEELYRAADSIVDNLDARYEAFAKADAHLLAHAIFIPTQQAARAHGVTKVVPFTAPYAVYGNSADKYKGIQLQDEIVTVTQYEEAKAAWDKARSSAE